MKEKLISILKLLFGILLFFIVGTITKNLLDIFNFNIDSEMRLILLQLISSIIIFVLLFLIYFKEIKKDFLVFNKNIKDKIIKIIKLFLVFLVVKYIVSFVTAIIMMLLKLDMNSITSVNQELIETYIKRAQFLMAISTSLLAPIYEELLFRLGFKKVFGNNMLFVVISGTLFGLLHVFPLEDGISLTLGIVQSISYVSMGIFLAYVYKKYNNIYYSIGIHFLNNFISILTMINML